MLSTILIYVGLSSIVGSTFGMCHIINTCDIVPKKKEETSSLTGSPSLVELPASREVIDVDYVEQPVVFKNINDNPDLEKKYAELILKNALLEQKIRQREDEDKKIQEQVKNSFKKESKYSKLAEEILRDDN